MEELEKREESVEGSELSNVIINILDYYSFKQRNDGEEDAWKKDTKYEGQEIVPKEIDEKVKELFVEILTNLIQEEKNKRKNK